MPLGNPQGIPWWRRFLDSPGAGQVMANLGSQFLAAPNFMQAMAGLGQVPGQMAQLSAQEELAEAERKRRELEEKLTYLRMDAERERITTSQEARRRAEEEIERQEAQEEARRGWMEALMQPATGAGGMGPPASPEFLSGLEHRARAGLPVADQIQLLEQDRQRENLRSIERLFNLESGQAEALAGTGLFSAYIQRRDADAAMKHREQLLFQEQKQALEEARQSRGALYDGLLQMGVPVAMDRETFINAQGIESYLRAGQGQDRQAIVKQIDLEIKQLEHRLTEPPPVGVMGDQEATKVLVRRLDALRAQRDSLSVLPPAPEPGAITGEPGQWGPEEQAALDEIVKKLRTLGFSDDDINAQGEALLEQARQRSSSKTAESDRIQEYIARKKAAGSRPKEIFDALKLRFGLEVAQEYMRTLPLDLPFPDLGQIGKKFMNIPVVTGRR